MINIVGVGNCWTHPLDQRFDPAGGLSRIDHLAGGAQPLGKRLTAPEIDGVGEVVRPRTRKVLGIPHRKGHDFPAGIGEKTIVLEENSLGPTAPVVIVVDRQELRHSRWAL